ncbi:MAG TPA: hypothetical protein VMU30_04805 [Bacteroidota bacterium]|nr:hypothetical protein [Bacteroidota bacterium]
MQRNIIINSTMLFVVAAILEMTLHELGHFFASILVHAQHISIYHNYTSNTDIGLPLMSTLFIKSAGPCTSLVIGFLFHFLCSRQARRNILFLFNLYMSLFGYIGFWGYLIIAPMTPGGDTGYICSALGCPTWLTIALAIIGAITLYYLINSVMRYFVGMGSEEIIKSEVKRKEFIRSLVLLPLIIGIIITTILNLPVPVYISLIAPICGSLTILCGYDNASKKVYSFKYTNNEFEQFNKPQLLLYGFFFFIILINRLLVYGIHVN